jgi:hypothetical protein
VTHRIPTLILAGALLLPALHPAHAQIIQAVPNPAQGPARYSAGIAFDVGQPLGDFSQNVGTAWGLDGFGTLGLDSRGIVSLRAQLGWLQYSRKTEDFFVQGAFGTFELESETKSGVLTLGVGPQIMAPSGLARPYLVGTVGFSRFQTETAINVPSNQSNSGTTEQLASETPVSDFTLSLTAQAGVAFQLSIFGNSGVLADLGVRYHHNGLAEYVSSNGVQYDGTGTPTITPTTSEADFLTYRIGIVIPIR